MNKSEVLIKAQELLDEYWDKQEAQCRAFKWICHDHLPQHGEEYTKNINVFEIEAKTIIDIHRQKKECRDTINNILQQIT